MKSGPDSLMAGPAAGTQDFLWPHALCGRAWGPWWDESGRRRSQETSERCSVPLGGGPGAAHTHPWGRKRQAHGHARGRRGSIPRACCAPARCLLCGRRSPRWRQHLVLRTPPLRGRRCPEMPRPGLPVLRVPSSSGRTRSVGCGPSLNLGWPHLEILSPAETPFPSVVASQVGVNLVRTPACCRALSSKG